MILADKRLQDILKKYSVEDAKEVEMTLRDQILIEQLKALNAIKNSVRVLFVVTILGIIILAFT